VKIGMVFFRSACKNTCRDLSTEKTRLLLCTFHQCIILLLGRTRDLFNSRLIPFPYKFSNLSWSRFFWGFYFYSSQALFVLGVVYKGIRV